MTINVKSIDSEIKSLQRRLKEINYTDGYPGILCYRYVKCGRSDCKCKNVADFRHGPYLYQQYYDKDKNKLVNKYVKKEDTAEIKKIYKENKEYKAIMKRLKTLYSERSRLS